jgi:hypothetical protein
VRFVMPASPSPATGRAKHFARHCRLDLGDPFATGLFVGSCKSALSGVLFALIYLLEILIVPGGDSAHTPNPQTDRQANTRKYVDHTGAIALIYIASYHDDLKRLIPG